jgi:hypothetical protein
MIAHGLFAAPKSPFVPARCLRVTKTAAQSNAKVLSSRDFSEKEFILEQILSSRL